MNCTSLSLYASSVHVICINNKHLSVYKTGDKFVFPHYIVWCITCMVVTCIFPHGGHMFIPHAGHVYIPHLISPIESSTKTPLWGFVLFIILLYTLSYYIFIRNNTIHANICSAEVLLGSTSRASCDGESAFFPECLNRTWSEAISFRFESMIKIL